MIGFTKNLWKVLGFTFGILAACSEADHPWSQPVVGQHGSCRQVLQGVALQ